MSTHRKPPITITCLHCGKTFETYPSRAGRQFCSQECQFAHASIIKICPGCGKDFAVLKSRCHRIYCSQECYFAHHELSCPIIKGWQTCVICGATFQEYNSGVLTCSSECHAMFMAQRHPPKPQSPKHIRQPKSTERTCAICGARFQLRNASNQTCSETCRQALILQTRGAHAPIAKVCAQCGKEFTVPWGRRRAFLCSNTCRMAKMPKGRPIIHFTRPCLECGQPVEIVPALAERKRFCSRPCAARYRTRMHAMQSPTSIEVKLYAALNLLDISYDPQHGLGRYVVDAWLLDSQTIIEADGTYWHSLPDRQERDRKLAAYAAKQGYRLIHLDEQFIKQTEVADLARHIQSLL